MAKNCKICDRELVQYGNKIPIVCSKQCEYIYKREKDLDKPRKAIKKVSDKRKTQEKMYKLLRQKHLILSPNCERCNSTATEIHHTNGREGERLNDNTYFLSVCRNCHTYIHNNPKEAREKGWLL